MFLPIFFGGCGISAMWKLASAHWRVLISRRSGNEAKYDFFHNDGWKVFCPHCILNHTVFAVLRTPGTLVDLECEMLGGGFNYFLCSPYLGKWSSLTNIFEMGWNHHLGNDLVVSKNTNQRSKIHQMFVLVKPTLWWFLRLAVFVVSMAWARRMPVPGVFDLESLNSGKLRDEPWNTIDFLKSLQTNWGFLSYCLLFFPDAKRTCVFLCVKKSGKPYLNDVFFHHSKNTP